MRVLIAFGSVISCGFLSCIPLFRIAYLRGRWFDWTIASTGLAVEILGIALIGSFPDTDHRTDVGVGIILFVGIASAVYFVIFDARHFGRQQVAAAPYFATAYGYPPGASPQPGYGYGYPPQAAAPPVPPPRQQPAPPAPPWQPPAQQPQHPRIDRVRAELDELSDILRKEQEEK